MDLENIVKKNIEQRAIVCIDEFDKLIKNQYEKNTSSASTEGVQNDFLPLFDGSDVPVKLDEETSFTINTRNILFVALGAFTKCKPSDLIAEIQGRLPIQCSVEPLKTEDYKNIITNSKLSSLKEITALLKTEGLSIEFTDNALEEIANTVYEINQTQEDTGARRIVSVISEIIKDISYYAPDIVDKALNKDSKEENKSLSKEVHIVLDEIFVKEKCKNILKNKKEIKKFVL